MTIISFIGQKGEMKALVVEAKKNILPVYLDISNKKPANSEQKDAKAKE